MTIAAKEATDLTVTKTLNAAIVFAPGGVDAILEKITAEVRAVKTDISTPAGRTAVASLAYKVARSKTALDEMGKNLVGEWKAKANAVDAERRTIREKLDALRDEVRKPLDDWEEADRLRIEAHEAAIAEIIDLASPSHEAPAIEIQKRLSALNDRPKRDWQEFAQRAGEADDAARKTLKKMLEAAEQREAERAELERLRREQIEREQKERDDKIAAEAAEKARVEAEAKAAAESKAAAEKAEQERQRIENERLAAIARAEQAEADRVAAEEKAEANRKAAAEKAEREKAEAVAAEKKRVADEAEAERAATAKREANKKHLAKINTEVLDGLEKVGLTKEQGIAVITAIVRGEIPHTRISY